MKLRNIIQGLVAITLLSSSCDYLDVVPKGKFVVEDVEDYMQMLETPQPYFDIDMFGYVADEKGRPAVLDVLNYRYPHISAAILWDESIERVQYLAKEDVLYNSAYKRIAKYNIIINGMPDAKGDGNLKALGIAQAKILRAYHHFFLVNAYAKMYTPETAATDRGIIIQTEFNMEVTRPQSTVAQVYKSIEDDIEAALPNLPDETPNVFLPGKALGYALKAKVALFKGEFDKALTAALEVEKFGYELIDLVALYNTNPMMPQMLSYPRENSEAIFHQCGSMENSSAMQILNPGTVNKFDAGDTRLSIFFYPSPPARPTMERGARMFTNMMMPSNYNVAGIRFSEVCLMIAECYARKDDYTNAMKYLNAIRVKRILPANYTPRTASSKTEAIQLIRKERDVELVLTCNKFFDMRRFMAEDKTVLRKTFEGQEYTLNPGSHLLVLPFSVEAMQGNPNLIQNSK